MQKRKEFLKESWSDQDCGKVVDSLVRNLKEHSESKGSRGYLISYSGGLDSTICLILAKMASQKGQVVEALYMPSKSSMTSCYDQAKEFCKNFGIRLNYSPIKFIHSVGGNLFRDHFAPLQGQVDQEFKSRLRATIIYARARQLGAMVLNTLNRTKLGLGLFTLYGDSVGALGVLGNLYQTEVLRLGHYLNHIHNGVIPEGILTSYRILKWEEESNHQRTQLSFERLDAILEALFASDPDFSQLVNKGFDSKELDKVLKLYQSSEHKRRQFCPVIDW